MSARCRKVLRPGLSRSERKKRARALKAHHMLKGATIVSDLVGFEVRVADPTEWKPGKLVLVGGAAHRVVEVEHRAAFGANFVVRVWSKPLLQGWRP